MMIRFENAMRAAAAGAVALLLVTPPLAAQGRKHSTASMSKQDAPAKKAHRLILQVNSNEPAMMNLALNNATNVAEYYKGLGEKVSIEVVTYGPGLHMLRDDTSPVKARIETISLSTPEISFQ